MLGMHTNAYSATALASADEPCRLLHLVSTFAIKTDTKWLLQIARHLDRRKYHMLAACFYGGGQVQAQLEALGVQTFDLGVPRELDPRAMFRAQRLIARLQPDIVHTHLLRADIYGAVGARLAGVPVDAACARLPTHAIAVSEAVKSDCVARHGMNADRITVIHTGVEPPATVDVRAAGIARASWGCCGEEKVILTLARLSYEKGIDTLIDAASVLRDTHPEVRVIVLGEGPDHEALQSRILERQVEDVVKLAGFTRDVWSAIAAADVVCLPSKSEGLPNVLLEAMAMARPIVATRVGGIPEALTDEHDGLLVEPNRPHLLAHALGRVLHDTTFAARLGRAAQATMQRRFHARDVVGRYEALYTRLLKPWRKASDRLVAVH
jgi:glycosyltransferase involved in cell wall biosynthesis